MVVVLPAPFGPKNPTISPFPTSKLIWSMPVTPAYFFVSCSTLIIRSDWRNNSAAPEKVRWSPSSQWRTVWMTLDGRTAQFKLFHFRSYPISGNGETKTLSGNSLGGECHFHRTNSDQRAREINEWSPAVTRVYCCIRLQHIVVLSPFNCDGAIGSTENSTTHRTPVAQRVT